MKDPRRKKSTLPEDPLNSYSEPSWRGPISTGFLATFFD
jgi:hypothetical protein